VTLVSGQTGMRVRHQVIDLRLPVRGNPDRIGTLVRHAGLHGSTESERR